MNINRYLTFENGVKVFFGFSILFALAIPYLIEGNFIYELQRGNLGVFLDMLGPLPAGLISDTFTIDFMFWEPRGIELVMLLFAVGLFYIVWFNYKEHVHRLLLCDRCAEQNYSSRFFFSNPEDPNYPMCLDCYYEVYGKFEDEYEKIRSSPEERERWRIWGEDEIARREATIEYRKKARSQIASNAQEAFDKMNELREEEEEFTEEYEDYDSENDEGLDLTSNYE